MTDLEFFCGAVKDDDGSHTIGDYIRAVLAIDNEGDAGRFYRGELAFVQRQMDAGKWEGKGTATQAAHANIGWCFGEGMIPERIAMWGRVCDASHPVFGTVMPSPEVALKMGCEHGEKLKRAAESK